MNEPNPEKAIFAAARQLPPEDRAAYLNRACGDNGPLRRRIEALLNASEQSGAFLEVSAAPTLRRTPDASIPLAEKPGDKVGRYKLLQQIGEGGCGVVYMAEQEEPVRRRVALKVIKLGMETKSVLARFEAERQALALMDHPNIARVLDAGATGTGRPYFVMELVRGMKITNYCDEAKLSFRGRLELFMQVCHAIQHAHQKGIIHRDIKPSNILVTINDGEAVPKVIDFGIAKATGGQRLTEKTVFTAFEQFIGTPAYMSPEQAMLTSLDIDTRSDIYALGVLLYEMLTGKTPFDAKELLAAGLDEMRRAIREKEPERPSTRLSTLADNELGTTAQRRGADAPKLISQLRGDLDWIVMKCIEKDRSRRYETANGLAADIQRHMQNEPVAACPPSRFYRFQKMARRNRLAFAAVGAVAASLMIGLGASTWMLIQEKAARLRADVAEQTQARLREEAEDARRNETKLRLQAQAGEKKAATEAAKSKQVARFLQDMLNGVGPSVALGKDTQLLKEILDKTAKRVGKDLTNQPEVEIELRQTLAETYLDLGFYDQSEAMAREAVRIAKSQLGEESPFLAEALHDYGAALDRLGKWPEAEAVFRQVLAMRKKSLGEEHADIAVEINNLGNVLFREGKLPEAEATYRQALAMRKKLRGEEDSVVADILNNLANVLLDEGKLAEAEAVDRQALAMGEKLLGENHPVVAMRKANLGNVLQVEGKLAEAEAVDRQALAMRKRVLGQEHPDVASSLDNLAGTLWLEGKLPEAEELERQALPMRKKLLGAEHPDVARSLFNLGSVLALEGKLPEGEALCRESLAMREKLLGATHPDVAKTLVRLSYILCQEGKLPEAETTYREALAMQKKLLGNEHPTVAATLDSLGDVLDKEGKPAEAEAVYREVLATRKKLLGAEHADVAVSLLNLGLSLAGQGKLSEAETTYREGLAIATKLPADQNEIADWLRSSLLRARTDFFARHARWKEATAAAAHPDFDPTNHLHYHDLAALLVQTGDLDGYRKNCQREVALFRQTKDPAVAERMAKDCLILPNSGVDMKAAADWADLCVKNSATNLWFQFVKSLAEYRFGHFTEAVNWAQSVLSQTNLPPVPDRDLEATAVLAMAGYQLHESDAARQTLDRAAELESKLPKLESGADLGDSWLDLIIANKLMREAKGLIEGGSVAARRQNE